MSAGRNEGEIYLTAVLINNLSKAEIKGELKHFMKLLEKIDFITCVE